MGISVAIKVLPFQLYADYIYNRLDAVEYTYMSATPFLRAIISYFFYCNKGFSKNNSFP